MKVRLLLLVALFVSGYCKADSGELVLEGVYQGKNLFVQNPFNGSLKEFCTEEVIINNKVVLSEIKSSAFEIDLSSFKMDEALSVKIVYKDDCKPKVINPHVINSSLSFQYKKVSVEPNMIAWSTQGETSGTVYLLEKYINDSWLAISAPIKSAGPVNDANYILKTTHHSGLNKYRVKSFNEKGQVIYSKVYEFLSQEEPVSFYPRKVVSTITLSKSTTYQILDNYGSLIKKGEDKIIDVTELKPGTYYLNIDNRTEKFVKK